MKTVIEMAEEAGFETLIQKGRIFGNDSDGDCTEEVEALVALVRADEREACAKVCANMGHPTKLNYVGLGGAACAAAIRARGETK